MLRSEAADPVTATAPFNRLRGKRAVLNIVSRLTD